MPKLDRGRGPSPIWQSEKFLNPIITKLDKHVVRLPINYIASKIGEHGKRLNLQIREK